MADWNESSIDKMIKAIEREGVLWNKKTDKFLNKTEKENAWKRVSEKTGTSIELEALKNKWNELKVEFGRKRQLNGRDWRHYESMCFLNITYPVVESVGIKIE